MLLHDPTVPGPERNLSRAAALAGLEGRTIGLLENGKLNAVSMLRETAAALRGTARLHGRACLVQVERQRARARRDLEGGGGQGRFPDNGTGRLRLLFDVQFA